MYVLIASASSKGAISDSEESHIFNLFYSFFLGLFMLVALNTIYTISMTGFFQTHRILFNIWTPNETKAATYYSLQVGVLSAISAPLFILGIRKNKWHYCLFSVLALLISFYGSIMLANRSFFVTFALSFLSFLFIVGYKNYDRYSKLIWCTISAFLAAVILFLIFFIADIANFQDIVAKIPILNRFFSGGSDSMRIEIYKSFFINFWKYPLGGLSISGDLFNGLNSTQYAHNVWLDIYGIAGIIPLVSFVYLTMICFNAIIVYVRSNKTSFKGISLIIAFVGLFGVFLFEPVIQSDPYIFSIFFMFCGLFDKYIFSYKYGKNNANYSHIKKNSFNVVFISNFLSIHVLPLHRELAKIYGERYTYISTTKPNDDHIAYGLKLSEKNHIFMFKDIASLEEANAFLKKADVIVYGNPPWKTINKYRKNKRKIIIRSCERLYKNRGFQAWSPRAIAGQLIHIRPFDQTKEIIFSMSAYLPYDCSLINYAPNRIYNWGYWTDKSKCVHISKEKSKDNRKINISFVNRLIPLKHPEHALELAKYLKAKKYDFMLTIIGEGEKSYVESLVDFVHKNQLDNYVTFKGRISNEEVRDLLIETDILLSCSDSQEGWGVTVGEGMAHGCAVVSSYLVGSAPSLIVNYENGLLYDFENINDLFSKIDYLINDPSKMKQIQQNAFIDFNENYSPELCASRFDAFIKDLIDHGESNSFSHGPLSKAVSFSEEDIKLFINDQRKGQSH